MFAPLLLAAFLAPSAPIPKKLPPVSPPPKILYLTATKDGSVLIPVLRDPKEVISVIVVDPKGGPNVSVSRPAGPKTLSKVPLTEVKELRIESTTGQEVKRETALEQLQKGGLVLISVDGKKVDPIYTRLFKEELYILFSPEFPREPISRPGDAPPSVVPPSPQP